jgi:integrase
MARDTDKLSDREIETFGVKIGKDQTTGEDKPVSYLKGDGQGLWIKISPTGTKSWVFRQKGKAMGLGSYARPAIPEQRKGRNKLPALDAIEGLLTIDQARAKAAEIREAIRAGKREHCEIDPKKAREELRQAAVIEQARKDGVGTFAHWAGQCIDARKAKWVGRDYASSEDQWRRSLAKYVLPHIGDMLVDQITTNDIVEKVLKPLWGTMTETGVRLRSRIEAIIGYAYQTHADLQTRTYTNPAQWKLMNHRLGGTREEVQPSKRMPTFDKMTLAKDLPVFMAELRARTEVDAKALELIILTACRREEICGLRWDEIDEESRSMTIPPERMKGKKGKRKEHRVPLSDAALRVIEEMRERRKFDREHVFPGRPNPNESLGGYAPLNFLQRELRPKGGLSVHGMRQSFKTWASETTDFGDDISEAALAHKLGGKVHQSYMTGDLFEKRRGLMQAWADACYPPPAAPAQDDGVVVPFAVRKAS